MLWHVASRCSIFILILPIVPDPLSMWCLFFTDLLFSLVWWRFSFVSAWGFVGGGVHHSNSSWEHLEITYPLSVILIIRLLFILSADFYGSLMVLLVTC